LVRETATLKINTYDDGIFFIMFLDKFDDAGENYIKSGELVASTTMTANEVKSALTEYY
jgi:hypothetical protein